MGARRDAGAEIEFALRRHFSASFTEAERMALVAVIQAWDCTQPDLDRSARLQAWLAIARESLAASAAAPVTAAPVAAAR